MQVIQDQQLYNALWDRVYQDFGFRPAETAWLNLPQPSRKYRAAGVWTETQEKTVNSIFAGLGIENMYALDWQHDCFVFSPQENTPCGFSYYDAERDCNVYFPSYYPDGDYFFFLSQDFSCGLFGHPQRSEICVMGDPLIEAFENLKEQLGLSDVNEGA